MTDLTPDLETIIHGPDGFWSRIEALKTNIKNGDFTRAQECSELLDDLVRRIEANLRGEATYVPNPSLPTPPPAEPEPAPVATDSPIQGATAESAPAPATEDVGPSGEPSAQQAEPANPA